jgi:hypothetical protein
MPQPAQRVPELRRVVLDKFCRLQVDLSGAFDEHVG